MALVLEASRGTGLSPRLEATSISGSSVNLRNSAILCSELSVTLKTPRREQASIGGVVNSDFSPFLGRASRRPRGKSTGDGNGNGNDNGNAKVNGNGNDNGRQGVARGWQQQRVSGRPSAASRRKQEVFGVRQRRQIDIPRGD